MISYVTYRITVAWRTEPCHHQSLSCPYVCILVSCDRHELRFGKGKGLHSALLICVFSAILVHLDHMQPGLVLVKRLQNHHLDSKKTLNRGVKFAFIQTKRNATRLQWPKTHCRCDRCLHNILQRGIRLGKTKLTQLTFVIWGKRLRV